MDTSEFFDSMNLKGCTLCKYVPAVKRASGVKLSEEERLWRMKNHYVSRSHTTNLRKSQLGNKFLDLSDEGFLEYYTKRLPAIDGFQERETYMGFIKQLITNIEIRRLLQEEGIDKGYLKDD